LKDTSWTLIKVIYQIPIANGILTGEIFETFLLRSDRRELCFLSLVTFYLVPDVLDIMVRRKK
jgi:hypothetical protein